MTRPLSLWLVCDGKPGHENQSLGLAEAIGRRMPAEMHRVSLAGERGLTGRVRAAVSASAELPKPDLIIAAGHATHPSLLWLARKHGALSVVLMKPSLPMSWFDFCIAPSHDFPSGGKQANLRLTRGAINRVVAEGGEKSGKLILIGGPSAHHGWDEDAVIERLSQATDRGGWLLGDSRRTPEGFLDKARRHLPGVTIVSHKETPADWVPEQLRQAKEVWVSEDSVSMIYEALTSGARVGLLPVPQLKAGSRVQRGIDELVAAGFLTRFSEWTKSHRLASPPEILNEADRCAQWVMARTVKN